MRIISSGLLILVLAACSSSDDTPATTTNQISTISSSAQAYMASAIPEGASAAARATSDWAASGRGIKRPGDGSSATSIQGYFSDLLNPDYAVEGFSPTVFGRFGQEMEVLEIIGAQVPFTNGAPTVGTHSITAEIGDDGEEATFDVVVTAATNDNFDVILNITSPFVWMAAFKNSENKVNIVSSEIQGDTDRGISILFWDTDTGKLRYDFIAKQATGTLHEVHRYFIEETGGQAHIAHIYEGGDVKNYAVASAADGGDSTEYSASFQFDDGGPNDFGPESYCVSSAGTATDDSACAGTPLANSGDAGDLDDLYTAMTAFLDAKAMAESILGTDYANLEDVTPNYDTDDLSEFLTDLP